MQRRWLALFLSGVTLLFGANSAFARHSLNFTNHGKISTCSDFEISSYWDRNGEVARAQEEHALTGADAKQIDVTAYRNGGVSVIGWEKPDAQVLVCKAASADTKADAENLVKSLKADISGGTISGSGPETDEETWIYFIVHVPTGAKVTAHSTNGPIEVHGTNGSLDLEARNGPIALGGVRGTVKARTQNGPIAFTGSDGDVQLETQNGPIAVSFDQTQWQGKGLEAHVQNGPLSIAVPANYNSGVEITTAGHAPIVCASCEISSTYGRETIRLGAKDAPVLVRLSTVNGPVNIAGPKMF